MSSNSSNTIMFIFRQKPLGKVWILYSPSYRLDSTGWNIKIVAQEKTTWFHFCLMKTGFLFFVADHLLVDQLCTNPKSDRSLLSCLKVTQCPTSKIGDAPQYNSCSLPIQVMTTGPLPAPSKCKSGWFNTWGHSSTYWTSLWRAVEWKDTARKTQTKEFIEKVRGIIDETLQRLIRQIARDLGVSHTTLNACVKEDLKCTSYRCQTSQILTEKTKNFRLNKSVSPPLLSRPEPAGLLCLVIRREHHQHDLPQHQSQTDRRHPPSICQAPAEYLLSSRRHLW